jgi:hypothetical protein
MKKLITAGLLAFALVFISITSDAQDWVARHAMSPATYQSEFNTWNGKGYRLTSLTGYTKSGQELYAAIWKKQSGAAWAARHGMSAAQYQTAFTDFAGKGYRPVSISGYAVGGQAKFAAIWDKSTGPAWAAKHNMTAAAYQAAFTDFASKGYRIRYVSGYVINGTEYFAAIWDKSRGTVAAKHNMTAAQYQAAFTDYTNLGCQAWYCG